MNAEYLLDAIGRLDDDLIQEAERYRRPKARYGRLLGLAASFAVVIALGYVLTHVGGMRGGGAPSFSGGGNNGAPASGNSAPSGDSMLPGGYSGAGEDGTGAPFKPDVPTEASPTAPSGENAEAPSSSSDLQGAPPGAIFVCGAQGNYILTGEVLAELPEGGEPVLLGTLSALYPDSPSPCTTVEEYVGLNLWAENDGADILYAVYVELPEGGFARAELVEP